MSPLPPPKHRHLSPKPCSGADISHSAYAQLRHAARLCIRRTSRAGLLQTTALANEAWLRLRRSILDGGPASPALMASVLRSILVDTARREGAARRGRGWRRIPLESANAQTRTADPDLLDLDQALKQLEHSNPRAARIVDLRFFGGLSVAQAAAVLGVSERTVEAEFRLARAILRSHLERL